MWKNVSERVQQAAVAATHQLVEREDQRRHGLDQRCVLCNDSYKVAEIVDIVDDWVHEEGALRPFLVPLCVHEGGVHAPVQEPLVEQDAVGELHCVSTQSGCLDHQMATGVQCFTSIICVCHHSHLKNAGNITGNNVAKM